MKQPLKVLSTSLGLMLVGHMLLAQSGQAETAVPEQNGQVGSAKLVEWSTDAVKQYFDANVDWNLPVPADLGATASPSPTPTDSSGQSSGVGGSSSPVIVNHYGGGFGWDDLLLYHLILNSGSPYSSSRWVSSHPSYDYRTKQPYVAKTYTADTFANRSKTKTPTTSSSTGSFTTNKSGASTTSRSSTSSSSKSSSTSSGSIGGRSGGFSSGSSSSSGS
ncbi:hypothetical protein [Paenibacillus hexagrammi]|uniref:Uncharacterized protein n=1 Tax=Paenibacillus hexagrammi TaxID=2908839 RepID=A0ABY3SNX2_9BACL|nr:hypothetical protein [Paenibacillus sp. YPD9-1]UJF34692.1 hypothetical protein L0M14_05835 [Paenibacillus sp. YPD9-1]